MIIENGGGNDYKIPHMGKESMERRGLLPRVLDITPTTNAWLNPMMDDDSNQDSDDLDDDMHVPMTTATPTVEMDGEGGENATTDALNTHPAHVTMGRVGAMAITCTHRCRWFCFVFLCCCLPSMMTFVDFCEGRKRGSILYSPK